MAQERTRTPLTRDPLSAVPWATAALLLLFALVAQPDRTLLTGLWTILTSEAGLITDPMALGGVGAGLLNAALVLLGSTALVRSLRVPCTGVTLACLFMMAGFALLGKNPVNMAPIVLGGWLHARYKREPFSSYLYLSLFGTCLAPTVSFLLVNVRSWLKLPAMVVCGVTVGFLLPAVVRYTVRIHQGYNLYNVGVAAGFLSVGVASVFKGFGIDYGTETTWSQEGHVLLCVMVVVLLWGLFAGGVAMGCRRWEDYRLVLRHSGRAVADFVLLDGPARTLVNMSLVGLVGLAYLLLVGARLNGPLVCCLMSMVGYASFGKHPKNVIPVMAGAYLSTLLLGRVDTTSPTALLGALFSTGLAPIAGQFGWYWGMAAGFLHVAIVQNTGLLQGGMNLYNNGFAAGLVCVVLIPVIEALRQGPKE